MKRKPSPEARALAKRLKEYKRRWETFQTWADRKARSNRGRPPKELQPESGPEATDPDEEIELLTLDEPKP